MNKNTKKEEEIMCCKGCGLSLSSDYFKSERYKEKGCPECGGKEYVNGDEEISAAAFMKMQEGSKRFPRAYHSHYLSPAQQKCIEYRDKIKNLEEKIKEKDKYIKELERKRFKKGDK